jgi:hypothetical protein
MLTSRRIALALSAALLVLVALCSTALAMPITVQLRVEGSTSTLYEGPLSSAAIENPPGLETAESNGSHACDVKDNGSNGGFGTAATTPTSTLDTAAAASGLAFDATWSTEFNDFDVTRVGGDISNSAGNGEYWGYAVNYTNANVGGCQFQLAPGSEVLWAYNYFGLTHLLSISGPAGASVGTPFTVHVSDGQTGESIAGAAIGEMVTGGATAAIPGSATTDANGNATLVLTHTGSVRLKATKADSVRSNGLLVCVHNGNDGTCGTSIPGGSAPSTTAPSTVSNTSGAAAADVAKVAGIQGGRIYPHRRAPRVLSGTVKVPAGGTLRQVRISLLRRSGGRCFRFDGRREAFVRGKCGAVSFFSVGGSESFSYLLPAALPPGRYVYDIEAINSAGQATKLVAGVSHVVFRVR